MGKADTSGLALGTPTRMARSALKRAIAAGDVSVADLLLGTAPSDAERVALGMTLGELLGAAPQTRDRVGRVISRACVEANSSDIEVNVRLREMTTRERGGVAVAMREEAS